jgi:competence protein ComEC
MSKSKIFLYFCFSFILGIFLSSYIKISTLILVFLTVTFLILISVWWDHDILKIIGFCGLFLVLGIWRQIGASYKIDQSHIAYFNDKEKVSFEGIVLEEPDVRVDQIKLTVDSKLIRNEETSFDEDQKQKINGKVLLSVPRHPEYQYGDRLLISCKLKTPQIFEGFSYKDYLARYNVHSVCYYPEILLVSKKQGNFMFDLIYIIKDKFENSLNQTLSEPYASFSAGLLLGSRGEIPKDLLEKFNTTGITHIIAISGYNITIISTLFLKILSGRASRKIVFIISCIGISIFVILTGASSSVTRAAIMGIFVLVALNYGRLSDITNSLIFTACVILLFNPKILAVDLGFQLSFLATIGIVYFSPYFEKIFHFLPQSGAIRESVALTFSAQVLVTPVILTNFERISLIAPLANLLILPIIPLSMLTGFLTGFLGLFWLFLGKIMGFVAWGILNYEIFVVNLLSRVPFASITIKNIWPGTSIIYYIFLAALIFYLRRREIRTLRKVEIKR